jgi:hypothetical protein
MPSSTNPGRVLLFGRDRGLLEIRALVLKSARLAVDIVTNMEAFKKRIAEPDTPYGVVVCCYTTPATECQEAAAIAARLEIPLLQLDCIVQPTALIAQVTALLSGQ